jgi:hypothetical protein
MIAFVQLPLGFWQATTAGLGDLVQGTFIGMGAGAHVAGGVALVGALVCVGRGLAASVSFRKHSWLLGAILLFIVPILGDAKQNIIAFLPAVFLLLFLFSRIRWSTVVVAFPVLAIAVVSAFSYYPPLQLVANWDNMARGVFGNLEAYSIVFTRAADSPGGLLFGLGPGNSVSRVALMGSGFANPDSSVWLLGLRPAPVTQELLALSASDWLLGSSSVWSGIASWLALFGDLGFLGLGLYLWMSLILWRHLTAKHSRFSHGRSSWCCLQLARRTWVYSFGRSCSRPRFNCQ